MATTTFTAQIGLSQEERNSVKDIDNVKADVADNAKDVKVLKGNITELRADIGTNAENISANASAISAETTRAKGVESGIDTRVKTLEGDNTANKANITNIKNGTDGTIHAINWTDRFTKDEINTLFNWVYSTIGFPSKDVIDEMTQVRLQYPMMRLRSQA